jgi:NADH-quinone oxidoreductase subunit L
MSVCAGWLAVSHFVLPGVEIHAHLAVMGLSVVAGAVGIGAAFFVYGGKTNRAEAIAGSMGGLYRVIKNKFYIDEVYLFFTQMIFRFIAAPAAWIDRHIVDGAMNLSANLVRKLGDMLNLSQTGQVQTYGVWMINGTILVLLFLWLVQR